MSDLNLKAEQRNITGRKVSQLRREGLVPVVVYGAISAPINLQVAARDLERTLHAGGASQVVSVAVAGGSLGDGLRLRRSEATERRADANHKAVAGLHRTQGSGAPALDLPGGHAARLGVRAVFRLSADAQAFHLASAREERATGSGNWGFSTPKPPRILGQM